MSLKKRSTFIKAVSILCACLIPILVTGPFLPDLIVSILSLCFLYYSFKNKIYGVFCNKYFYTFIIFCLICILSSLLSDNIIYSLKASLFYLRIGVFALLISYLIDQNKKILDYFYYTFIITFSILIIDGYTQYFTGSNLFGYKIQGIRVSSFFGNELILGSYLSRLSPLLFALFVVRKNKNFIEVSGFSTLFILIGGLVFLSGERASFILLNISNVFIFLFIHKYKWQRLCIFVFSMFLVIFFTLNDYKLYDRYIASPIKGMNLDSSEKKIFSPAHDSLIRTAWSMFLDKPIIGHGPKLFRIKCSDPKYAKGENFCDTHPHNFYVQLLAETGVVGFSFLAGLFFHLIYLITKHIYDYIRNKKYFLSDYQICLLSGLLITIWPLTTNGNIFTNYLMIIYSLQMGFFRKKV